MPLPNRVQLTPRIQIPSPLQSQSLSPTKLKVSRPTSKFGTSTPKVIEIPQPPAEEVCLRWNSHHSNMQSSFPHLLELEKYVDVTLIAEGKMLKCHRMILSSCSPYFEEILSGISPLQHPVIILNGVSFWVLKMLADFMYAGEVNIDQNKVPELLDVAGVLKIKGLGNKSSSTDNDQIKKENDIPKKAAQNNTTNQQITTNLFNQKTHRVPKVEELLPISDPLQLLETNFLEVPTVLKPKDYRPFSKKKLRKRKSSDEDSCPSPPLFPIRRGTRSRPYVKVPKCYDYEDIVKPMGVESPQNTQPFSPVHIKSEPVELEENDSQIASPHSEGTSEFSDMNDIALKLKSLRKSIDIQPIPPILKNAPQKSATPYKIKLKSFSNMVMSKKQNNPSTLVNEDPLSCDSVQVISATSGLDNEPQESTVQGAGGSNTTKIIDIVQIDKTDQAMDVQEIHNANFVQVLERNEQNAQVQDV